MGLGPPPHTAPAVIAIHSRKGSRSLTNPEQLRSTLIEAFGLEVRIVPDLGELSIHHLRQIA